MYELVLTTMSSKVADLFFVHQRGSMNGIYLWCVTAGVCSKCSPSRLKFHTLINTA